MAVCGHCWVCRQKFDCSPLRCCEKGTPPLLVERPGDKLAKICNECERDIESGAVAGLLDALRALR